MQHLMLNQEAVRNFVIATERQTNVRNFVEKVAEGLEMRLEWRSSNLEEIEIFTEVGDKNLIGKMNVLDDARYFRPIEVEKLLAHIILAGKVLNWLPENTLEIMIDEMVYFEKKSHILP